jgi:endoglucanase
MLDAAYAAIRKQAPTLLLVLDGGEGGNLEGTTTLDGFSGDPNILFSFHYYRPWQFTHQGLAGMAAQYLTDVPYPRGRGRCRRARRDGGNIAAAPLAASQKPQAKTTARHDLESYRASAFDRATVAGDFDKVARWAREHGVPAHRIILGEFGAMNNAQRGLPTRQAERQRWFSDVRGSRGARFRLGCRGAQRQRRLLAGDARRQH